MHFELLIPLAQMISRFNFNISLLQSLINIFKLIFFKDKDYSIKLKKKLVKYYPKANFYFFDHGRTALFEALSQIKDKTNKRKVIVNSMTLFEVINIIIYAGFEPVFLDNNKNSFNTDLDLSSINQNKNELAAIIITHLNGVNESIVPLKNYLDKHNKDHEYIYLIEDCAVSLGAKINKIFTGSLGDFSFLSFNIMKNITSYTGGLLIDNVKIQSQINNNRYIQQNKFNIFKKIIFVIIIQTLNSKLIFNLFFKFVRFSHKKSFNFFLKKYRTDFVVTLEEKIPNKFLFFLHPFQMKIILEQFDDFELKQSQRIENSKYYYENLKHLRSLAFPQENFDERNIFLDFPLLCDSKTTKDKLFTYLLDKNIDVKNYYYKNCCEEKAYYEFRNNCNNSKVISENIIMLPVHNKINKELKDKTIREIKKFLIE